MKPTISQLLVISAIALLAATPALADQGDCAQPVSKGALPTSADALYTLQAAVGRRECPPEICDVNADCQVSAVDALGTLMTAVGAGFDAQCPSQCPLPTACESSGAPVCDGTCPDGMACVAVPDDHGDGTAEDGDGDDDYTMASDVTGSHDDGGCYGDTCGTAPDACRNDGSCDGDGVEGEDDHGGGDCLTNADCSGDDGVEGEDDHGGGDCATNADCSGDDDSHGSDGDRGDDLDCVCMPVDVLVTSTTISEPTTTSTTLEPATTTTTTLPPVTSTTTLPPATTTTTTVSLPSTTTTTTLAASAGQQIYDARCAGCHSAGSHDTMGFAGNLARRGNRLVNNLGQIDRAMSGLMLTDQEISDLAAFLNSL